MRRLHRIGNAGAPEQKIAAAKSDAAHLKPTCLSALTERATVRTS